MENNNHKVKEENNSSGEEEDLIENKEENLLKILKDFVTDLLLTFPELKGDLDKRLLAIYEERSVQRDIESIKEYCEKILPEKFFDIIYQNVEIFEGEKKLELLPGIDFNKLWRDNITDTTRETIWKYLQLLLFTIVSGLKDNNMFKESAKLFEAIDENALKSKLEDTIKHMEDLFKKDGDEKEGDEDNRTNLPDPEKIHEHVTSMMGGKLGNLAKEIAEETAKEMDLDETNIESMEGVFEKLFKNPMKIMSLVKKVGNKLDEKMKSGDLKESELLEEASNMMEKMKDTPGFGNIENLLGKMGMGKGKMNTSAMQANLMRNLKLAKQKERMKKKQENKEENKTDNNNLDNFEEQLRKANEMAMELLQMENNDNDNKNKKNKKNKKKKRNKDK